MSLNPKIDSRCVQQMPTFLPFLGFSSSDSGTGVMDPSDSLGSGLTFFARDFLGFLSSSPSSEPASASLFGAFPYSHQLQRETNHGYRARLPGFGLGLRFIGIACGRLLALLRGSGLLLRGRLRLSLFSFSAFFSLRLLRRLRNICRVDCYGLASEDDAEHRRDSPCPTSHALSSLAWYSCLSHQPHSRDSCCTYGSSSSIVSVSTPRLAFSTHIRPPRWPPRSSPSGSK